MDISKIVADALKPVQGVVMNTVILIVETKTFDEATQTSTVSPKNYAYWAGVGSFSKRYVNDDTIKASDTRVTIFGDDVAVKKAPEPEVGHRVMWDRGRRSGRVTDVRKTMAGNKTIKYTLAVRGN
jgi:hypothetical protein